MKVNVIVHIHTKFSFDSNVTLNEIIYQCKKNNISYIGITDHCTAKGGISFRKKLEKEGIKVIIGEEIMTSQGEIIGLFLKDTIYCKNKNGNLLTLKEAIRKIRLQQGLVFVPHHFDILKNDIFT